MRKIYSIIFCFLTTVSVAQKETILWYFSNTCALDFTSGAPVALGNSAMNQYEGSSSICDHQGNLLFYTDGMSIWNSNHVTMPNGTGLMGNFSSNQSALIVPDPANTQQYYVFCNSMSDLYYSVVDMTLNGGLGDVTTKNVFLKSGISEKLAGVKHANGFDYWVMVHGAGNSDFFAYLVTAAGVNTVPVTTTTGMSDVGSIGQMQFSPDGKWVAFTTYGASNNACVSEFDNTTGIPFNSFDIPYANQIYGCTFSPSSKYFYHQGNPSPAGIYQYDLSLGNAAAIIASGTSVGTGVSGHHMGQMQIGPDKKVYIAMDGLNYLAVINSPDSPAASVNFLQNGVPLIGTNGLGLPNYVASYFTNNAIMQNFCFGDTTTFVVADSTTIAAAAWDFGDPSTGPLNVNYNFSASHVFSAPGMYTVQLILVYINTTVDTLTYQIEIKTCNSVVANLSCSDTLFCDKNCIDFFDQSQFNPTSWQWTFTGASPSSSTDQNPVNICYNNYGSFDVTLIACNAAGCDTVTFPNFITEFQLPAAPVITLTGNTLSSTAAFSYQWFIVGDTTVYSTTQTFTPTVNGNYYVLITDSNGCQTPSNVVGFFLDVPVINSEHGFTVSPNPFNNSISIHHLSGINGPLTYLVYDVTSRVVKQGVITEQNNTINLEYLADGIYTLAVVNENFSHRVTLVKQK